MDGAVAAAGEQASPSIDGGDGDALCARAFIAFGAIECERAPQADAPADAATATVARVRRRQVKHFDAAFGRPDGEQRRLLAQRHAQRRCRDVQR